MTKRSNFEWDSAKNLINQEKHCVSFALAQLAFLDHRRIILEDLEHGEDESRFYCLGKVTDGITDSEIHLSKKQNQNHWRRVLAEREKDI